MQAVPTQVPRRRARPTWQFWHGLTVAISGLQSLAKNGGFFTQFDLTLHGITSHKLLTRTICNIFVCAVWHDSLWSAVSKPPDVSVTNVAGGTRAWPVTVQNASEIPILQFRRKGKKDEFNFNSTTPWSFISWLHFLNWNSESGKLQAPVSLVLTSAWSDWRLRSWPCQQKGCKGQETVKPGGYQRP